MDYDLSGDQALFRDATRDFLEKEVPLARVRERAGFDPAWWRRGAELGWTAMLLDGGDSISGNGLADLAIVAEEMGRLVSPGPLIPVNIVIRTLSAAGGFDDVVEELVAGSATAAWAVYEPGSGWNPGVSGVTVGPGPALTGVKDRVDSGDQADYLLVTAGADQYLVRASDPGVTVRLEQSLDMTRRFARVEFDRAPAALVPASAALQTQTAAALQSAELAGAAGRVLEFTIQWAFDRYSFGRPLASYQALKHWFANMKLWHEAMQATASAAARAVGSGAADAAELASVAKAYAGQRATDIVQDCVQLHGGIGVTWEHDIHLYLRRVTADRVMFGTPSEHKRLLADLILEDVA